MIGKNADIFKIFEKECSDAGDGGGGGGDDD